MISSSHGTKNVCVCGWGRSLRPIQYRLLQTRGGRQVWKNVKAWKELNDTDIFGSYENNQANTTTQKVYSVKNQYKEKCDVCDKKEGEEWRRKRFICAHCMTWWRRRGSCCDFFPPSLFFPLVYLFIYLSFIFFSLSLLDDLCASIVVKIIFLLQWRAIYYLKSHAAFQFVMWRIWEGVDLKFIRWIMR